MGICERIKTEKVLYDQRVFLRDDERNVPLGLPSGVRLLGISNPVIQIDVIECDAEFDEAATTTIRANLIIEFSGALSDGSTRNFEFSFPIEESVPLPKLDVSILTPDERNRAFCQVFDVTVTGPPTLTCRETSFDIFIELAVKLKIAVLVQIVVALCPPAHSLTLSGGQIRIIPCPLPTLPNGNAIH